MGKKQDLVQWNFKEILFAQEMIYYFVLLGKNELNNILKSP